MDQQPPSQSLEELMAALAAKNAATGAEQPSPGRDALAALIARLRGPTDMRVTDPASTIGIRG